MLRGASFPPRCNGGFAPVFQCLIYSCMQYACAGKQSQGKCSKKLNILLELARNVCFYTPMKSSGFHRTLNVARPMLVSSDMKKNNRKSGKNGRSKRKSTVMRQYFHLFPPVPAVPVPRPEDSFSLEQPSMLRWVPSETTYGVGCH